MAKKCKECPETKDCCQILSLSDSGVLTIGPYGNSVSLCEIVKSCETQTTLYNVRLVGNILEITYIGEDSVPQVKQVDFTGILGGGGGSITVQDTNSIDLNLASNILSAALRIDSASTAPISSSSAGVRIDCCPETLLSVVDSNTIDFSTSGPNSHILTGSVKYTDSATIDFSESGSGFTAGLRIDPNPLNILTATASGALVSSSTVRALISGTAPISYSNTTGVISISQANGSTDGYLSSVDFTTFNNKVNDGINVGGGSEVFKQKTGVNLEFRTIVQGSNISIVEGPDEIVISSSAAINPKVDYIGQVTDFSFYSGTADAIIVGSNESTYIRYSGLVASDGFFIVSDATAAKWKMVNVDVVVSATDTTYVINANKSINKLIIKPVSTLTGFKVGTSLAADDIIFTQSIAGGISSSFIVNLFADGANQTIFIGGITSSTNIKVFKS